MDLTTCIIDSPVGPLQLTASERRLVGLNFYRRSNGSENTKRRGDHEILEAAERQLNEYFSGRRTHFDVPLELRGPEFYRLVWQALIDIPYGETISYGQLAARVGGAGNARAVGAANGANPIAIIVPCHRVIGADGTLVGYGGGLHRKRTLLDLESKRLSFAFADR